MPQEAGAGVGSPDHHRRHPRVGLVLGEAHAEAHPPGVPARSGPPAARTPHPAAGPPRGLVPHGPEEANPPGPHRDSVWGQRVSPHHGALQLW